MSTVIVLGGCGAVGSVVVKTLAAQDLFSKIIIGDINEQRAAALISTISPKKISFVHVNAEDPASIHQAIRGRDLVVNCIGPFYKTVNTILRKVIELKINYDDYACCLQNILQGKGHNRVKRDDVNNKKD